MDQDGIAISGQRCPGLLEVARPGFSGRTARVMAGADHSAGRGSTDRQKQICVPTLGEAHLVRIRRHRFVSARQVYFGSGSPQQLRRVAGDGQVDVRAAETQRAGALGRINATGGIQHDDSAHHAGQQRGGRPNEGMSIDGARPLGRVGPGADERQEPGGRDPHRLIEGEG